MNDENAIPMNDKVIVMNDGKEITSDIRDIRDIRNTPPTIYKKNPPRETVARPPVPDQTVARPSVPDKIKMTRTSTDYGVVVSCFSYETIGTETRETRLVLVVFDIKANIKSNIKAKVKHKNIDGLCKLYAVLIQLYSLYKYEIDLLTTQMIEIDYEGDEEFVKIIEKYMGKEQLRIDRERKIIIVDLSVFLEAFGRAKCPIYIQRAGSYKKKRKKRPTKRKNRKSFKKRKSKRKTKRR
uniref:Uncharacterized protein n=1 Tax=viral metagenome TaxID=1070528 RepID=A0A6C0F6B9_9ZZZZ|tara:strand:- start:16051 stop:16767 length:717 start_codon:yes stop_codon:yes gene_type:complete